MPGCSTLTILRGGMEYQGAVLSLPCPSAMVMVGEWGKQQILGIEME
jgi:hypothetical protein